MGEVQARLNVMSLELTDDKGGREAVFSASRVNELGAACKVRILVSRLIDAITSLLGHFHIHVAGVLVRNEAGALGAFFDEQIHSRVFLHEMIHLVVHISFHVSQD